MATILLSSIGAAIGGSFGGTILGLTGAAIGKAVGATLGSVIDQKIMGSGSQVLETGRMDSFRLQGVHEGASVPRVMGRARVAGQMIWSSAFQEHVATSKSGGGKGAPSPKVTTKKFSYSISVAFALGEGVVDRIGRVWADGQEIAREDLQFSFYSGTETQAPDPLMTAIEGAHNTPSYRGTAYVVFEDLDLSPFGNRIPQLNFEIFRKAQPTRHEVDDPALYPKGVCLIPGSGEYTLATEPVAYDLGFANGWSANENSGRGGTDVSLALEDLYGDLPNVSSVALVVSWFGSDLRCSDCSLMPKVEHTKADGREMPWAVAGLTRYTAPIVSQDEGRPVFGGTPADAGVLQAIAKLKNDGQKVVFYPFILMDIQVGNDLPDPYTDQMTQPPIPWRGRITSSVGPGRMGTPDKTAAAAGEVASFFGTAALGDFSIVDGRVQYTGPNEWSYRRFVLHYAHLCALAGGVEGFNIGSELRGLTQIRDGADSFPAVAALGQLASDVRTILGASVNIGYAADWSEYFGYHPNDGSEDVLFHLDPLWAHPDIDYIGIDNYMPLADWRDRPGHADEAEGSIYSLEYLRKNIAGGEGFDWYYANDEDRDVQNRLPITDGAYGEDWVFRYKDLINWWDHAHHNRIGGVRQNMPTAWVPQSKPIRFTELGCPAVDKGANQPNVFFDPKSSESALPYFSSGAVDVSMQMAYLQATYQHWQDPLNNPVSGVYSGTMVDMDNSHVWAWDARPWPEFPNRISIWSDGENYGRGHWLTGRFVSQSLANIVAEICEISGLFDYDVSGVFGAVTGFVKNETETARQSLQPLMLAYDFTCAEVGGKLVFQSRRDDVTLEVQSHDLVIQDKAPVVVKTRAPEAEIMGRVRVSYWDETQDYQTGTSEYRLADDVSIETSHVQLPISMRPGEATLLASRSLIRARIGRDDLKIALPPSQQNLVAGDVIKLSEDGSESLYRVDRIEEQGARVLEAVRIEHAIHGEIDTGSTVGGIAERHASRSVFSRFLDLPLLRPEQTSVAPFVVATAAPWPGGVSVYQSASQDGFAVNTIIEQPSKMAITVNALPKGPIGVWDNRHDVIVNLSSGGLESRSEQDVLNGANAALIGSGASAGWEMIQFREASLQGDGSYRLSGLLRGQLGSDADMPAVWPAESEIVFLDTLPTQIDFNETDRGLVRNYRVGPVDKRVSDPQFLLFEESFDLIALRPYAPVHLHLQTDGAGSLHAHWIRRTRIAGDSWQGIDVPLGEAQELYQLRVLKDGQELRSEMVSVAEWHYSSADQAADGAVGDLVLEVAQVSDRFGPGAVAQLSFNL